MKRQRFDDFRRAHANLAAYRETPTDFDVLTLTGFVALYEICFEQAWKAMKEALEASGAFESKVGSPRMILKEAYAFHMIDDEQGWLDALQARNEAAHSYNEETALAIVRETRKTYLALFDALDAELSANWYE